MSDLVLTKDDGFQFILPCLKSLYEYGGPLFHKEKNFPHPAAIIVGSWERVLSSALRFLIRYNEAADVNFTNDHLLDVARTYEDLIYNATELSENMCDNIKSCLLPKQDLHKWKPAILSRWTEHPRIACNQIKHKHNSLIAIEVYYPTETVRGYAVCQHVNEVLVPNNIKMLHAKQEAFAYGSDMRRIFAHLYLIANAVHLQIEELGASYTKQNRLAAPVSDFQRTLLKGISDFMPSVFQDQTAQQTAKFFAHKGTLTIADSNGILNAPGIACGGRTSFKGDGFTNVVHVFYSAATLGAKKYSIE